MATAVIPRGNALKLARGRPCVISSFMKVQPPVKVVIRYSGWRKAEWSRSPRTKALMEEEPPPTIRNKTDEMNRRWKPKWKNPNDEAEYSRGLVPGSIAHEAYKTRDYYYPPTQSEFSRLPGTPSVESFDWDDMLDALIDLGHSCKPSGYVNKETMDIIRRSTAKIPKLPFVYRIAYSNPAISDEDMIKTGRALMRNQLRCFRFTGHAIILSYARHGVASEIRFLNAMLRHIKKLEVKSPVSHADHVYLESALEKLAQGNDIEAMILWGQIVAYDGQLARKKNESVSDRADRGMRFLEKAFELSEMINVPLKMVHCQPAASALGDIKMAYALTHPDPEVQAKADKDAYAAYKAGALRHDDPYAYHQLAILEMRDSPYSANWLSWITKAASSGYEYAAYDLGQFYDTPTNQIKPETSAGAKEAARLEQIPVQFPGIPHLIDGKTGLALEWCEVAHMGKCSAGGLQMARIFIRHGAFGAANSILRDIVALKGEFVDSENKSIHKDAVRLEAETQRRLERLAEAES